MVAFFYTGICYGEPFVYFFNIDIESKTLNFLVGLLPMESQLLTEVISNKGREKSRVLIPF